MDLTSLANSIVTQAGAALTSIFGKTTSTVTTSGTGSTSSVGTTPVVISESGTGVISQASTIFNSKWFWPIVIGLVIVVLFWKTIKRMFR